MRTRVDRTGQRYGKWTVLRELWRKPPAAVFLECRCDCGVVKGVYYGNLATGKSTGCAACGYVSMTKYRVGGKLGCNTILTANPKGSKRTGRVRCDLCGYERRVSLSSPSGRTHCAHCRRCAPPDSYGRIYEVNGERHNLIHWARKLGVGRWTIQARLKNGWSIKRALTTPLIPKERAA